MKKTRNRLIKDFFPIWFSWYRKLKIPESERAGKPRKAVLPIGGKKYEAAAMMLLFPRGLQNADKIAKQVGSSGGTVRNWMIEVRFKDLIKDLEDQFSSYILTKIHEKDFFDKLHISHDEIGSWSDRILETLIFNIDKTVGVGGASNLTLAERLLKNQGYEHTGKGDNLIGVRIPRIKFPKPAKSASQELLRDISNAALESYQVWPKSKRGPRPPAIRENERSSLFRFAKTMDDHLTKMDQAFQAKKSKIELKAMMKTAHLILHNMMEEIKD